mgnify:FL=1
MIALDSSFRLWPKTCLQTYSKASSGAGARGSTRGFTTTRVAETFGGGTNTEPGRSNLFSAWQLCWHITESLPYSGVLDAAASRYRQRYKECRGTERKGADSRAQLLIETLGPWIPYLVDGGETRGLDDTTLSNRN